MTPRLPPKPDRIAVQSLLVTGFVVIGAVALAGVAAGAVFDTSSAGDIDTTLGGLTSTSETNVSLSGSADSHGPNITRRPTILNFGNLSLGNTVQRTMTVGNDGHAPLSINGVNIIGNRSSFSASGVPNRIAPGSSATIRFTFSPQQTGRLEALVTIENNDTMIGAGLVGYGEPGSPALSLSTQSLSFGTVDISTTATQSVQLQNTGSAPLSLNSVSISGSSAFSASSVPDVLQPGGSTTVNVQFVPTDTGQVTGSLAISSNASDKSVSLSGTGEELSPQVSVSRQSIAFGSVGIGDTAREPVTISNPGNAPLAVSAVSASGNAAFQVSGAPGVLQPGASKTLNVEFNPSTSGQHSGSVSIGTNASDVSVSLSGQGTSTAPNMVLNRSSIAFGDLTVGSERFAGIRVENTGNAPLSVSGLRLSGSTGVFSASGVPATVPPGGQTSLRVRFGPQTVGSFSGTLTVQNNATSRTISLSGSGVDTSLGLGRSTVDFGVVKAGSSETAQVQLRNNGSGTLRVDRFAVTGGSGAFSATGTPVTLSPGDTAQLTITFAPSSAGQRTARVRVGPAGMTRTISVSGTGLAPELSLSSNQIDFRAVEVGTSQQRSLRIANTGTVPLDLRGLSIPGSTGVFSVESASAVIDPGTTVSRTVQFSPSQAGNRTARLELRTNATERTIPLAGSTGSTDPSLSVSPGALDFDTVRGTSVQETVRVTNNGSGTLTIGDARITGSDASEFSLRPTNPDISLGAGESSEFAVRFTSNRTGSHQATLRIEAGTGSAGAATVALRATVSEPALSLAPETVDFGRISPGKSVTRTVTVRNEDDSPVAVSRPTIAGDNASAFDVEGGASLDIPGGGSTDLNISFFPYSDGPASARLVLEGPGGSTQASATLNGTGAGPKIALSTRSLKFTDATVNETSRKTVTIRNDGTADLELRRTTIVTNDEGWALENAGSATLGPGQSRTMTVAFTPTDSEPSTGLLHIASNDPFQPNASVYLSNTGADADVDVSQRDDRTNVNVSVRNASGGQKVSVPVPSDEADPDEVPENETDAVAMEEIWVRPKANANFTLNISTSNNRLPSTPSFQLPDGTKPLGYVSVAHSLPNRDIDETAFIYRVRKDRLDRLDSDPGNVSMYRHANGTWEQQPTTLIRETDEFVVLRTTGDGLSEWTAAAKRPRLNITEADTTVDTATTEEEVTIQVFVENTGGTAGLFEAKLLLDGEVVDLKEATVPINGSRQINFQRSFQNPGLYEVQVNNVFVGTVNISAIDRSAEVETNTSADPSPQQIEETQTTEEQTGGSGLPITFLTLLAVLVVVAGGIIAVRYYRPEDASLGGQTDEDDVATSDHGDGDQSGTGGDRD